MDRKLNRPPPSHGSAVRRRRDSPGRRQGLRGAVRGGPRYPAQSAAPADRRPGCEWSSRGCTRAAHASPRGGGAWKQPGAEGATLGALRRARVPPAPVARSAGRPRRAAGRFARAAQVTENAIDHGALGTRAARSTVTWARQIAGALRCPLTVARSPAHVRPTRRRC